MNYAKKTQTISLYSFDEYHKSFNGQFEYQWIIGTGLAANSTEIAPPPFKANQMAVFDETHKVWSIVPNYKGKTVYNTETKQAETVTYYGSIKEGFTLTPPQNYETWDGEQWADQRTIAQKRDAFLATLHPLSRRQFKLILLKEKLLKKVEQLISQIEDETQQMKIQIEYEESTEFIRTSDAVLYMCQLLQLTDEKIDRMWQEAMNL